MRLPPRTVRLDTQKQRRRASLAVLLAVATLAALTGLPQASAVSDRFVAAGGTDAGNCSDADNPCATIGFALGVAGVGDTVVVGPGSYDEAVTVAEADLTLRSSDGAGATTISGNELTHTVLITSADVTVDGFTVRDGNSGIRAEGDRATIANNNVGSSVNGITLVSDDNLVHDNDVFDNTVEGISIQSDDNVVRDNLVHDNANDGIDQEGPRTGNLYENNVVRDNADEGIDVGGEPGMVPTGNVIRGGWVTGNNDDGLKIEGAGNTIVDVLIELNGSDGIDLDDVGGAPISSGNLIANNIIRDNGFDSGDDGLEINGSDNVIRGNEITGNSLSGIDIEAGRANVVIGNELRGNGSFGVETAGDETWIVGNGIVANGTAGIDLDLGSRDNRVHFNAIVGNGSGITRTATGAADARFNWWGDASGPSGGEEDPVSGTSADGSGDSVGPSTIRFGPWLGGAALLTAGANVPPGETVDLLGGLVDSDGAAVAPVNGLDCPTDGPVCDLDADRDGAISPGEAGVAGEFSGTGSGAVPLGEPFAYEPQAASVPVALVVHFGGVASEMPSNSETFSGSPPTRDFVLGPGWNITGWTGATSVAEATAPIAGDFDSIFRWDTAAQAFDSFQASAPPFLNTLTELDFADAFWILVTDPAGTTWPQPAFSDAREVPVPTGISLHLWTGPNGTPIEQAVATIAGVLETVFLWDVATQQFQSYRPDLPPVLNTAETVDHGDGVWLFTTGAGTWAQPASGP